MNVELILKYWPAVEVVFTSLGEAQRAWLNQNVGSLAPYLQSKEGQDALLILFSEFGEYITSKQATV